MPYDNENIFAKILRGEIPCDKIYENDHALAFRDIQPQAPVHILVISKGAYLDHADFETRATDVERLAFYQAIGQIVKQEDLGKSGYRLISNTGVDGGQEVLHYHTHILGGHSLGKMLFPV